MSRYSVHAPYQPMVGALLIHSSVFSCSGLATTRITTRELSVLRRRHQADLRKAGNHRRTFHSVNAS